MGDDGSAPSAPRTAWRVVTFWGLMLVPVLLWAVGIRLVARAVGTDAESIFPADAYRTVLLGSALMLAGALFATRIAAGWFEETTISELLGWRPDRHGLRLFTRHLALGGAAVTAIVLVLWISGAARIDISFASLASLGALAPVALFRVLDFGIAALAEEVADRGYVLRAIARHNAALAVVVTSLIFALTHVGAGWLTTTALVNAFLIGCVLAVIFLQTGSIWSVWGLHFGLNVFEVVVFQVPVVGYEQPMGGLLRYELVGPTWLTGGGSGLIGSVLFSVVSVMGLGVLLVRQARGAGPAGTGDAAAKGGAGAERMDAG